jgi:hypothetical protein
MLSCRDFVNHSHKYSDHQQTNSLLERINFAMHQMLCVHCRRYLKQYRLLNKTCEFFPKQQIPKQQLAQSLEDFRRIN